MPLLDETSGIVFLVGFTPLDDLWTVRVKQTAHGDKSQLTIVNASALDEREMTGSQWESFLEKLGRSGDFWAVVIHEYLRLCGGGQVGKA